MFAILGIFPVDSVGFAAEHPRRGKLPSVNMLFDMAIPPAASLRPVFLYD
jgi:hypothetical protein